MTQRMQVLSVNIGRPRANPWKDTRQTGIDKQPAGGPVLVTVPGPKGTGEAGLAGDRVFDVQHHGGPDQAVYAYAREDLDGWARELGRQLRSGVFGENLTTAGVDVTGARIGERWRVGGTLVLQVTCPRIPCGTFQGWLAQSGWIRRFTRAAVPGAYLRVLEPGPVSAGDAIAVERPGHEVTIGLMFRALTAEPDLLPGLLAAGDALPAETRDLIARRAQPAR